MSISAVKSIFIVLLLYDLTVRYLLGWKSLKTIAGIYTHAWLMLFNIELCVIQLLKSNHPHQRRLFIIVGALSFMGFCLLLRSFLLKDKGDFFDSKQFYITTFSMILLMAAQSLLIRITG